MSSREIAELTGKRHDNVVRDVEKMLNDVAEPLLKFEGSYIGADNTSRKCYNLPQNLTFTLVAGYRADLRLKIINRWMELESGAAPAPKPARKRRPPAFDVAYRRLLSVAATLPNFDENQQRLMAARGTHELCGVNPLELLGAVSLPAPDESNYLTPTQIGEKLHMHARAANQLLVDQGYQIRVDNSAVGSPYELTEKGAPFGRMFDTTRKHGKGSQQQLKWKPGTVYALRPFAKTPEAAL